MKLTILDGHAVNPGDLSWDIFKPFADVTVYERTEASEVVNRIGNSDAIFLNIINITKEILSKCPNLKYIGVLATGYNVIDLQATRERGITVTNIPSYSTDAVAQHVFAFITNFSNQVYAHNLSVQNGDWVKCPDFCYWNNSLIELSGKTLGIFGYGSIGKKVAQIAKAFGMNVIYNSRTKKTDLDAYVSFEELLAKSDFITLHTPLTKETQGIINSKTLSKIKPGAYLINTARGGLVVEHDVAQALKQGILKGYAADVISEEPMKKDNPLLNCPNCVLTPHLAWAPKETRMRLQNIALENLKAWLNGKIINVVN